MRNGRRERIEIEKERRERDKRELRRQFEGEEGGPKRYKKISHGEVT